MKICSNIIICVLSIFLFSIAYADAYSPVGYWKTIDDETGKPKAMIQIWETPDQALRGRILKIYPRSGQDQNPLCTACKGEKHNQRIVGMTILTGLRQNPDHVNQWQGGEILDPKNGKTYHCNIEIKDNGTRLEVRGYIGMPLFGRTQKWLKIVNHNKN